CGVAGVGKSRLLAEVAERSELPVIAARAFLPERDDAWALARSLLREALALDCEVPRGLPERPAQALAGLVPELEDLRALPGAALDPESRRALALEGSALLLWALGSRGALAPPGGGGGGRRGRPGGGAAGPGCWRRGPSACSLWWPSSAGRAPRGCSAGPPPAPRRRCWPTSTPSQRRGWSAWGTGAGRS